MRITLLTAAILAGIWMIGFSGWLIVLAPLVMAWGYSVGYALTSLDYR